jgi:tetratricopeptide (TPR) repeat protein
LTPAGGRVEHQPPMRPRRSPPTASRWSSLAVALALLALGGSAQADPKDLAREQAAAGSAAYNLGRYDEAAQHYEAAYRAIPDPVLLFNLGQAYRQGGKPENAVVAYKSFLRTAPAEDPNRALVERRIEELENTIAATAHRQTTPVPSVQAPRPSPGPPLYVQSASPHTAEVETPFYQRGWFWGAAAVVVAGGVVAALVLGKHTQAPVRGTADPGVVVIR